jgi:TolB-like protein
LASSYHAAERLLKSARQPVDTTQPLLVASLVNLANLRRSSNLGRIIAEQVASRLTQLGYKTREMKYRGNLLIRAGEGEFALSRGLVDISREQKAQAVIAGYYAVAKTVVYLKLELIRAEDAVVIATYDYELPLGPNVIALLQPVEG